MIDNNRILKEVETQKDYMIQMRRHFHTYPEVSTNEIETSKLLKEEVLKEGLEVFEVEGTGFYTILDTQKPGKTIGIRTDIDALPMQENIHNLKGERTCFSKNDGVMHACGHDGHMATVLGALKICNKYKDKLSGKIIFIFESAEETGEGISQMIEALKPLDLDMVYGTHLTSFMNTGEICIDSGARMAGFIKIEFDVLGKGGHGSRPDLSINPIFATANILTGLTSAWANQIDVSKTVTLGITQVHGGTANNIFPNSTFVGGSLRYFDVEEGTKALEVFKNVVIHTAAAHNCTVEFRKGMGVHMTPVINDDILSKVAREGVMELYPESLVSDRVWYASESFCRYSDLAPSVFAFVGAGNKEIGSGAEHHNEYFDLDEKSLTYSLGATLKFIVKNQA